MESIKKYEYMVTYSYQNGIGRICVTTTRPIQNYDDVENLDITIREANGFDNAFATNFILLRTYFE